MDPNDLTVLLQQAAAAPAVVTGDAGSVTSRTLPELIALDRYLSSRAARQTPFRCLRLGRAIPPGAIGREDCYPRYWV